MTVELVIVQEQALRQPEEKEAVSPMLRREVQERLRREITLQEKQQCTFELLGIRYQTDIFSCLRNGDGLSDDEAPNKGRDIEQQESHKPYISSHEYERQAKLLQQATRSNPNLRDFAEEKGADEYSAEDVLELTDPAVDSMDQVISGAKNNNRRLICCWPSKGSGTDYEDHLGGDRQYWRDIILGVNDGLVSTFLLVAGVTGAQLSNTDILLTAVSGTIAGAISMAAGEYVATKTQVEVMEGEIKLERKHIAKNRDAELIELVDAFGKIGIPVHDTSEEAATLRRLLLEYYKNNDEAHLQVHAVLELGVIEDEKRNPLVAGSVAFFLFFFGAMPSVIPFAITDTTNTAFIAAAIATTLGLLLVGAIKTWATRGNLLAASIENVVIAAGGGAIAYGVGLAFEGLVH